MSPQEITPTSELESSLLAGHYETVLMKLDSTEPEPTPPQPYDMYRDVTPYDNSVALKYGFSEYLNASFVTLNGDRYIACQEPRPEFAGLFVRFLVECEAHCLICLEKSLWYLKAHPVLESKHVVINGKTLIVDSLYEVDGRTLRVVHCPLWEDHGVLPRDEMEKLWEYTREMPKDKMKIIHCRAGVGRTGTFIVFKALKEVSQVTSEILISCLLRVRAQRTKMVNTAKQLRFLAEYFL